MYMLTYILGETKKVHLKSVCDHRSKLRLVIESQACYTHPYRHTHIRHFVDTSHHHHHHHHHHHISQSTILFAHNLWCPPPKVTLTWWLWSCFNCTPLHHFTTSLLHVFYIFNELIIKQHMKSDFFICRTSITVCQYTYDNQYHMMSYTFLYVLYYKMSSNGIIINRNIKCSE